MNFRAAILILIMNFTASLSLAFPPADIVDARAYCDNSDLAPVEGLWSYPQDDVTVLITRNSSRKGVMDIYVVESADCSLSPGMMLGELLSTPDPDKYTLKLFTTVKKGMLSRPRNASVSFSENKEALIVKPDNSLKVRLNPTRLLPSFWRMVSFSLKQPDSAPEGLVKIYPSYDGNGSSRRSPRYL